MLAIVEGSTPAANIPSDTVRALAAARRGVGQLDTHEWSRAVRKRDPVEALRREMRRAPINRAYFKLCEMQPLLPERVERVLLVCEAPGGFYQAAKRLYPSATRFACSWDEGLSFHPMVRPDVLAGLPHGGDVRKAPVVDEIAARLQPNSIDLVTADGGTFHEELDTVEQSSLVLLVAQLVAALRMNKEGGSCVIKLFEGSTQPTRDVVSIVRRLYSNVHLYKPRTSKAANSERYVIGRGMLNAARSRQMASELQRVLTTRNVLSILPQPDEAIGRAFDALASAQSQELQRLLSAAGGDAAACAALDEMARTDVAWLRARVPCLADGRGRGGADGGGAGKGGGGVGGVKRALGTDGGVAGAP